MNDKMKTIVAGTVLAALLVTSAFVLFLAFRENPTPLPAGTYESCMARMRYDLKHTGRVNEQAFECSGLSPDTLADIELEILMEENHG